MKDLLDLVAFENALAWFWIVATILIIVMLPRLFGLRYVNALAYAQMTLAFNCVPTIAGQTSGLIDIGRTLHFFATEFAFFSLTCWVYAKVLNQHRSISGALNHFFAGQGGLWLTGFMVTIGFFNFAVAPVEGESRIAYMTADWFSLVKPFIQLATPLAYVGIFVMLMNKPRRRIGLLLFVVTVTANVLTGSKASFLFSLATAGLALRDLSVGKPFRLRNADKWKLAAAAVPIAMFALVRLEVTPADVADRFMLFGEANILTYFSDAPTEACRDVSTLASMHRGVARAVGDASANDIDTLFGFALTKLYLGVNTMTGPNGRLSAYMICNFAGARAAFGWLMIGIYFSLLWWLLQRSRKNPTRLAVVFPYLVTSFGYASQDFNLIMADVTLGSLLLLTTVRVTLRIRRHAVH